MKINVRNEVMKKFGIGCSIVGWKHFMKFKWFYDDFDYYTATLW